MVFFMMHCENRGFLQIQANAISKAGMPGSVIKKKIQANKNMFQAEP